jgi:hypothetical protein
MDEAGKPREVPLFEAITDEEKRWQQYAIKLMDLRKDISTEMRSFRHEE